MDVLVNDKLVTIFHNYQDVRSESLSCLKGRFHSYFIIEKDLYNWEFESLGFKYLYNMKKARVGGWWSARINNKTRLLEVRERGIQDIIVFTTLVILEREKLENGFDDTQPMVESRGLWNTPEGCSPPGDAFSLYRDANAYLVKALEDVCYQNLMS